jgi:hypothetical protein
MRSKVLCGVSARELSVSAGLGLGALRIIAKAAAPRCGGKAPQLVSATR